MASCKLIISLARSNSLAFCDKSEWYGCLAKAKLMPKAVMISAWKLNDTTLELIEPLIKKLIELKCGYFVCVGKFSEDLHDFIDDVLLDMPVDDARLDGCKIMTTWHDTDTNEEVANFFLHATNVSNGLLLAFLDEDKIEDQRLKTEILNLVPTS